MLRADFSLPPDDLLLELGLAYLDFAVRNPDFFLLMFTISATSVPPAAGSDAAATMAGEMAQEGSSFLPLLHTVRGVDKGMFDAARIWSV